MLFARLNVTSKKITIFKLVSIWNLKPISLNNVITLFLILSVNCPFIFRSNIKPSSRYKTMSSCGKRFESCENINSSKFADFHTIVASHRNVKAALWFFLFPCFIFVIEERFPAMFNNPEIFFGYLCELVGKYYDFF